MKDFIKHLFIPRNSNNYRAKILQVEGLLTILLTIIALNFIIGFTSDKYSVFAIHKNITIQDLLKYTNLARLKYNLRPLKLNEKLSKAAEMKAEDMFIKNYWAHYAPDGTSPWEFILKTGYEYRYAGENLARSFFFSKDIVDAWMKSPSHRKNILRKEYTEIGFAIKDGILLGEPTTLVVQFFAQPLPSVTSDNQSKQKSTSIKTESNLPKQVLSTQTKKNSFNLKIFTFDFSLVILMLIAASLVIDYIFALKLKLIRNTSHNLITFIFISTLILGILVSIKGNIL